MNAWKAEKYNLSVQAAGSRRKAAQEQRAQVVNMLAAHRRTHARRAIARFMLVLAGAAAAGFAAGRLL